LSFSTVKWKLCFRVSVCFTAFPLELASGEIEVVTCIHW
jgi:hypothetical protein